MSDAGRDTSGIVYETPGLREVQARLYGHPGYVEHRRLEAFEQSLNAVFYRNLGELVRLLVYATDLTVGIELATGSNPERQREFNAQLTQRLHNYVAASSSLVDHSRHLMRGRPDAIVSQVEAQKSTLLEHPEIAFIKDLRNYTLHRSLPPVLHRAAMTGLNTPAPGSESEVTMSAEDLLGWDRWGSAAKAFLRGQTGDLALRPVIETHGYEMYKFNDWLLDLLTEENRPNLAAANELVVERNALVNRVDIPAARQLTEEWTRSRFPDSEQIVEAPGSPRA
jgi:hypothetical protein